MIEGPQYALHQETALRQGMHDGRKRKRRSHIAKDFNNPILSILVCVHNDKSPPQIQVSKNVHVSLKIDGLYHCKSSLFLRSYGLYSALTFQAKFGKSQAAPAKTARPISMVWLLDEATVMVSSKRGI